MKRFSGAAGVVVVAMLLNACESKEVAAKKELIAKGEVLFVQNCKVCHAQGINGAPIIGNKKMWGPRVAQGIPVLVEHASNGFGLMPAKGGKPELTTEDITAVVTYMVSRIETE